MNAILKQNPPPIAGLSLQADQIIRHCLRNSLKSDSNRRVTSVFNCGWLYTRRLKLPWRHLPAFGSAIWPRESPV
jgi:hypothetical protein